MYTKYIHHGNEVMVKTELKGKHREHCLCHSCELADFGPDRDKNCDIARSVYSLCYEFGLVLPVWECPRFEEKK